MGTLVYGSESNAGDNDDDDDEDVDDASGTEVNWSIGAFVVVVVDDSLLCSSLVCPKDDCCCCCCSKSCSCCTSWSLSYSVDWNRSRKRGDAAISRLSIVSKTCLSTHDCTCSEAANVNGSSDKGEEEAIYQNIISIVILTKRYWL